MCRDRRAGNPGSDESEQHHGEDYAGEHERVAGAGEGDEAREHVCAVSNPPNETDAASAEQNDDGTGERGADDLKPLGAEGDADALLLHAAGDGVGGHTGEAGDGEHGGHRRGGDYLRKRVMQRSDNLVLRQL